MLKKILQSKWVNHNTFGILISIVFLILLFYNININQVIASVKSFNLIYFIPAFLIYTLSYIVRTMRWKELLSVSKEIHFLKVWKALYIGYMANNLLPARMGELYRAHIIGTDQNFKRSSALASIFAERVFDGLTLVSLMIILIIFFYNKPYLTQICLITSTIFFGSFILIIIASRNASLYNHIINFIFKITPKFAKAKLQTILTSFIDGLAVIKSVKTLVFIIITSIIIWTLEGLTVYTIISGFTLTTPTGEPAVITPSIVAILIVLSAFSTMIPSGPAFIGPYQYAYVLALKLVPLSKDASIAIAVTGQVLMMIPVILIGNILLWKSHLSLLKLPNGANNNSN